MDKLIAKLAGLPFRFQPDLAAEAVIVAEIVRAGCNGSIAEQGNHTELIAKEGRYYQLHTYQARI